MTTRTRTYDPISGPFDAPPPRRPGTVLVVGTSSGFNLVETPDRLRLPAPEQVAVPQPGDPYQRNEKLATVGKEVVSKIFAVAQNTEFGRKWLGGKQRHYYAVDLSQHGVGDQVRVPSSVNTVDFVIEVDADVEVTDAERAVERGVRDVWGFLSNIVRLRLAKVASDHEPTSLGTLQRELRSMLEEEVEKADPFGAGIVKVHRVHATADLSEQARKHVSDVLEAKLKQDAIRSRGGVDEVARDVEMAATSTFDQAMAQWIQTNDPRYREIMMLHVDRLAKDDARRMDMLRMMIENKTIKDHDVHEHYPDLVSQLLHGALPPSPPPQRRIEDGSGKASSGA